MPSGRIGKDSLRRTRQYLHYDANLQSCCLFSSRSEAFRSIRPPSRPWLSFVNYFCGRFLSRQSAIYLHLYAFVRRRGGGITEVNVLME